MKFIFNIADVNGKKFSNILTSAFGYFTTLPNGTMSSMESN